VVFYHFGSVDELIDAACREAATEQVERYRLRFRAVASFRDLLILGEELHAEQRNAGNVTVLAQVLAGARRDPALAAAAKHALGLWIAEIEATLERLLSASPIAEVAGIAGAAGLARGIAAAFIGIELYEAADADGAESAFAALGQLSVLLEVLDDLEPAARRALRSRMRRTDALPRPSAPHSAEAAASR
jgi:AcrR family transcriptional regulator